MFMLGEAALLCQPGGVEIGVGRYIGTMQCMAGDRHCDILSLSVMIALCAGTVQGEYSVSRVIFLSHVLNHQAVVVKGTLPTMVSARCCETKILSAAYGRLLRMWDRFQYLGLALFEASAVLLVERCLD